MNNLHGVTGFPDLRCPNGNSMGHKFLIISCIFRFDICIEKLKFRGGQYECIGQVAHWATKCLQVLFILVGSSMGSAYNTVGKHRHDRKTITSSSKSISFDHGNELLKTLWHSRDVGYNWEQMLPLMFCTSH